VEGSDLDELEGQEAPGTPDGAGTPPQPSSMEDRLKAENAKLRQNVRDERAIRLGKEHTLPDSMVERLKKVPADEQEAWAQAIVEARGSVEKPPEGEPPPTEPENAEALATMGKEEPAGGEPPEGGKLEITPQAVAAFQRSYPDQWIAFKQRHPVEAESLMRGETVKGLRLTD
jgi:hypothetical protein